MFKSLNTIFEEFILLDLIYAYKNISLQYISNEYEKLSKIYSEKTKSHFFNNYNF